MHQPTPLLSAKSVPLSGTARIPGDKSISHRALMFGAVAHGETIISGLLEGEDVLCTAEAMNAFGAKVYNESKGLWRVTGTGGKHLSEPESLVDMGNSGTGVRLTLGLIAGYKLAATFTGDASLSKRPMKRVTTPLELMGARFIHREGGRLPLSLQGTDDLQAIEYTLPVASAQVKSAILLAALRANGVTKVIEPNPTRDHTERMLRYFGAQLDIEHVPGTGNIITIEGGQRLRGCSVDVPSDPSSAAFPAVAALLVPGSDIKLPRICVNERRTGLYETLREMGANIVFDNPREESGEMIANLIVKGDQTLRGVNVPPERVPSMIDEFPILAIAAACADGITTMTGLGELRVKESDRLAMMAKGLRACGVELEEGENSLTIKGNGKPPKGGAHIETALDHRIAMSFLVLGGASEEPIEIDDGAPIKTSFPEFTSLMNELGAQIGEGDTDLTLHAALH